MSSDVRNQLYISLRAYHESLFSPKPSNAQFDQLRKDLELIQDQIINMILSFVNGKAVFLDNSPDLDTLQARVKASPAQSEPEKKDKEMLTSKIGLLMDMLALASKATFKLRKPRAPRGAAVPHVPHVPQRG